MSDRYLYSRQDLEMFLPTVWGFEPRLPDGQEGPDKDMSQYKSERDPRSVANLWTIAADIKRAWEKANLTKRQRQVIYLRYAWDDLLEDIAHTLDLTSKGGVAEHLDRGMDNLLYFLNGRPRLELIV